MLRLEPNLSVVREGSGEPLILLHCLGVDHHFWNIAKPLTSDFTLYHYDLPGHGTSAVPAAAYRIRDLSEPLAGIMRAQNIDRAGVAGISLGGLIAQDFAAQHPGSVSRLILIDTTPRCTDELRTMRAERASLARSDGVATLVDGLLKIWFSAGALEKTLMLCTMYARPLRAAMARAMPSLAKRSRKQTCGIARRASKLRRSSFAATTIFQAFSMPPAGLRPISRRPNYLGSRARVTHRFLSIRRTRCNYPNLFLNGAMSYTLSAQTLKS